MPCSAVTLSLATIAAIVSVALLSIAFSTDNWLSYEVKRNNIQVCVHLYFYLVCPIPLFYRSVHIQFSISKDLASDASRTHQSSLLLYYKVLLLRIRRTHSLFIYISLSLFPFYGTWFEISTLRLHFKFQINFSAAH